MNVLIAVAACLALCGCASSPAGSHQPATQAGASGKVYMVEFKVSEVASDGTRQVVSNPTVMVRQGQEGRINIAGSDSECVLTALITEKKKVAAK